MEVGAGPVRTTMDRSSRLARYDVVGADIYSRYGRAIDTMYMPIGSPDIYVVVVEGPNAAEIAAAIQMKYPDIKVSVGPKTYAYAR